MTRWIRSARRRPVGSALAAIVATGVMAAGGASRAQDWPSPAGPRRPRLVFLPLF